MFPCNKWSSFCTWWSKGSRRWTSLQRRRLLLLSLRNLRFVAIQRVPSQQSSLKIIKLEKIQFGNYVLLTVGSLRKNAQKHQSVGGQPENVHLVVFDRSFQNDKPFSQTWSSFFCGQLLWFVRISVLVANYSEVIILRLGAQVGGKTAQNEFEILLSLLNYFPYP